MDRPTECYANVYRRRLQQMQTSQPTSRIQNTSNVLGQVESWVPPNQPTSRMRYFSLIFSVKAEASVPRSLKLCAKKVSTCPIVDVRLHQLGDLSTNVQNPVLHAPIHGCVGPSKRCAMKKSATHLQ